MICERAIGQADENDPAIDWVDLDWTQTLRRAMRLTSRAGRRVSVILGPGDRLRHRDVLAHDGPIAVAASVLPVDTLAARPTDVDQTARVALELGNQHLPVEVLDGVIFVLDDGPVREILSRHGVPFQPCRHRLQPLPIASVVVR